MTDRIQTIPQEGTDVKTEIATVRSSVSRMIAVL